MHVAKSLHKGLLQHTIPTRITRKTSLQTTRKRNHGPKSCQNNTPCHSDKGFVLAIWV